jgi:thioesterase domain-containing protein
VAIQPGGSRPPLFCIHGGAGTILFFHNLVRHLGPEQPIYGLQAQGLHGKEPPHTCVEEMVAHYIREIRSLQPEGPYYLGGYCFGAIVAFEMAQQLNRQGHEVALLASFNGPSPLYYRRGLTLTFREEPSNGPDPSKAKARRTFAGPGEWMAYLLARLKAAIAWRVRNRFDSIRYRIAFDMRRYLYQCYLALGWPMPDALRNRYFLENNHRAERRYIPQIYPGRLILFRARGLDHDPLLGWGGLAAGGVELHEIPGDHRGQRDLMREPHVRLLAEPLKDCLRRARGPEANGWPCLGDIEANGPLSSPCPVPHG